MFLKPLYKSAFNLWMLLLKKSIALQKTNLLTLSFSFPVPNNILQNILIKENFIICAY